MMRTRLIVTLAVTLLALSGPAAAETILYQALAKAARITPASVARQRRQWVYSKPAAGPRLSDVPAPMPAAWGPAVTSPGVCSYQ